MPQIPRRPGYAREHTTDMGGYRATTAEKRFGEFGDCQPRIPGQKGR